MFDFTKSGEHFENVADIHQKVRLARKWALPAINQEQLANALGVSRATVANWETRQIPPREWVLKIALLTEAPVSWFYDPTDEPPPKRGQHVLGIDLGTMSSIIGYERAPRQETASVVKQVSIAGFPLVPVPVIGAVAAGTGEHNVDPDQGQVYVPERLAQLGGRGWVVSGASMLPALEPGDITLFREMHDPRPGYTFLIRRKDGLVIKNIEYRSGRWMLISINPDFDDQPLEDGDEILGLLIGWYRAKGARETLDSDPGGLRIEPVPTR